MPEFDVYVKVTEDWIVRVEADTAEEAESLVRNDDCIDLERVGNYLCRQIDVEGSDPT